MKLKLLLEMSRVWEALPTLSTHKGFFSLDLLVHVGMRALVEALLTFRT